jgi:hypothetical protein
MPQSMFRPEDEKTCNPHGQRILGSHRGLVGLCVVFLFLPFFNGRCFSLPRKPHRNQLPLSPPPLHFRHLNSHRSPSIFNSPSTDFVSRMSEATSLTRCSPVLSIGPNYTCPHTNCRNPLPPLAFHIVALPSPSSASPHAPS